MPDQEKRLNIIALGRAMARLGLNLDCVKLLSAFAMANAVAEQRQEQPVASPQHGMWRAALVNSVTRWLALMAAGIAVNVGSWAQPLTCGPYQVAFYETGLLYFKDSSGEYSGIDKAIVEELAKRTGCVFVRFLDSRVRTWSALEKGQLDMTVSGIETTKRQQFAIFIPYIFNNRNHLVVRNGVASTVRTLQDFRADKSLRLGIVKGFVHGEALDAWIATLKQEGRVDEVADLEVLARVFAAGRVSAFLTQPVVWPPLIERNHLVGEVQMLDVAPGDTAILGLVLSRTRVGATDLERLLAAMKSMRADGTLESIFARFVGPAMAKSLADRGPK